ncbi:hypothetical protein B0H14DRAFT_2932826 [Mycena olivaceomarginata]|nr:hypothetical protein B0H14DRAFT_2932826 [Mycena olivaceomarginata]
MVGGGASDVLHFCEKIEDTTGELQKALRARLVGRADPDGSLPLRIGAGRDNARRRGAQCPIAGLLSPAALQRVHNASFADPQLDAPARDRPRKNTKTSAARAFGELDADESCAAFSPSPSLTHRPAHTPPPPHARARTRRVAQRRRAAERRHRHVAIQVELVKGEVGVGPDPPHRL